MNLIKDIDSIARDKETAALAAEESANKAAEESAKRGKTIADYLTDIKNQQPNNG